MAKSTTRRVPGTPILGPLFNEKTGYKTIITDNSGKRHSGYGRTPGASQNDASRKYDRSKRKK